MKNRLFLIGSINQAKFINARCLREAKKIFRSLHPKTKIIISDNKIF